MSDTNDIKSTEAPEVIMTVSAVNEGLPEEFKDMFIGGVSLARISVSATPEEDVISCAVTVNGETYEGFEITVPVPTWGLTLQAEVTFSEVGVIAVDRIYVTPYYPPRQLPVLEERRIICTRCDSLGNMDSEGEGLLIKARAAVASLQGKNSRELTLKLWEEGKPSDATCITLIPDSSEDVEFNGAVTGVSLSPSSCYRAELILSDKLSEPVITEYFIPTGSIFMHKRAGGRGVGYGRLAQRDGLFATAWDMEVDGSLSLGGEGVADFVTDISFSLNGWSYVKWHSGRLECFLRKTFYGISFTSYGGGLYTAVIEGSDVPYPEETAFYVPPVVTVTAEGTNEPMFLYTLKRTESELLLAPPEVCMVKVSGNTTDSITLCYRVTGKEVG